ncbi:MAG: hypothetical protein EOP00_23445, partial [Pedobacter sp.]
MAIYESGNHINVENLDPLMKKIVTIGPLYKPVKKELLLINIEKLYDTAKEKIQIVNDAFGTWKLVVDDRQAMFK